MPAFLQKEIHKLERYIEDNVCWALSTRFTRMYWLRHFLQHRLSRTGFTAWRHLTDADLPEYVQSLSRWSWHTRRTAFFSVKTMFRLLFAMGILPQPLHERTPRFFCPTEGKLHSVWKPEEINAVLAAIDRSMAVGKRNYAMILLAARFGLRMCDICGLELESLNWKDSRIDLIQQKTGYPLTLPLTKDVGEAVIDYLRNGRPPSIWRKIFLLHTPPFSPLIRRTFYEEVMQYRKLAGLNNKPGMGIRSFRYTLATQLLDGNVSFTDISAVLGHADSDSVRSYLRISLSALRQAALDPDEEVGHE